MPRRVLVVENCCYYSEKDGATLLMDPQSVLLAPKDTILRTALTFPRETLQYCKMTEGFFGGSRDE
jgi:hypothetical protein